MSINTGNIYQTLPMLNKTIPTIATTATMATIGSQNFFSSDISTPPNIREGARNFISKHL